MNNKYKWSIGVVTLALMGIIGYTFYPAQKASCHGDIILPSTNTTTSNSYKVFDANFEIPNKVLTSNLGEQVAFKELIHQDKPVFIQFIFTSCPTICPVLSSHFAALQEEAIATETPIQMISISIDPEYDTPERLQVYGEKFAAQSSWTFLTGKKTDIIQLQKAFDNYEGNKMYHKPITYLKQPDKSSWKVMDGFINGKALWQEYQQLLAVK